MVAAGYEARSFGVRSAVPSRTALRYCPRIRFVPPRFERYREVFLEHTPLVEPLSLNEAYLNVIKNL